MKIIYINRDTYNIFCRIKSGERTANIVTSYNVRQRDSVIKAINQLFENKIIVHCDEKEKITINKVAFDININIMYLIITDYCNLNCRYCFIENSFESNHKYSFMNVDTVQRSINYFNKISENDQVNKEIIFYGGEPLLNRAAFKEGVVYARKIFGKNINISLITNGTEITREDAKFIKANDINISISIDGINDVNNLARKFKNNKGSFNQIQHGYNNLKLEGVNQIGASITLGKHNIKRLTDRLKELFSLFDFTSVGFNFLIDFPNSQNPYNVDIKSATHEILKAFKYLRDKGIYEDRIMRKLNPLIEENIHIRDCGAIGNQIVVNPDGCIGPCHGFLSSKKYFTVNLTGNSQLINDISFIEWSKRFPLNMENCSDCEAIAICGGGCPYQAYISKGSIWDLDDRMCVHNKIFLEWAIWDIYENIHNGAKIQN